MALSINICAQLLTAEFSAAAGETQTVVVAADCCTLPCPVAPQCKIPMANTVIQVVGLPFEFTP